MKCFSIKNHGNQKGSQRIPQKTHKTIAGLQNNQFVTIYHYTHDEDHFPHPQFLKLASGTQTERIINRDKKHNEIYQKIAKKL